MADVKALEHPTLKVPYEVLNKKFRSAQKNIDREVARVQTELSDLETKLLEKPTVGDVSRILGNVVDKLNAMKRKAAESVGDEQDAARVCKRRIDHLKEHDVKNGPAAALWRKKRVDRMLVEYFLRCGYYDTALRLARHVGIEDLTNLDIFLVAKEVEESLANHDTTECLSWCYDNKSKLRKLKSNLEFNLRQQEFIELIRKNLRLQAVNHARKYFVNLEGEQLCHVQRTMGLLAFPPDTEVYPYRELLDPTRWQQLVKEFRSENFKLYQLNNYSVFTVTLQAGLSALKTPQCYHEDTMNPDCPVCSQYLNDLASKLPFAHCSQSRLVCHLSGKPLNEHNHPMMLPNGYVYGENALLSMAVENGGKITCPRTKQAFMASDLEKVFVM